MTKPVEVTLKPCPFCGPRMVEPDLWNSPDGSTRWQVNCGGCGASAGNCASREKAIAAWNTRHEATRELVEDKKRLDWLIAECADIRWISDGSDEVGLQIIKHHMAEPQERVVSEDWNENLRGCIDRAMTAKHTGGETHG